MSEIEVNYHVSKKVTVNTDENISEIKKNFDNETSELLFNGVDINGNDKVDEGAELDRFESNVREYNGTAENKIKTVKKKKKVSAGAGSNQYNSAIQLMKSRYNVEILKTEFKTDEADLHTVIENENLWKIAEKALESEGFTADAKAINNRIAQIAALNEIKNVNLIHSGEKLIVYLTDEGKSKVASAENQDSAAVLGNPAFVAANPAAPAKSAAPAKPTAPATKSASVKFASAKPAKASKVSFNKDDSPKTEQGPAPLVEKSNIEVNKNVDLAKVKGYKKDTSETIDVSNFRGITNDDVVEKFIKEDGTVTYQYKSSTGTCLQANGLKDLEKMYNNLIAEFEKIKEIPDGKTLKEALKMYAVNLEALKNCIALSGNNEEVIKKVADQLFIPVITNLSTKEAKQFMRDLLATKNDKVVEQILEHGNDISDSETANLVASLLKEIRAKENTGVKLTPEEIKLKRVLQENSNGMAKIKADLPNGIGEKRMLYDENGKVYYYAYTGLSDEIMLRANDPKKLDKIIIDCDNADTYEKKSAVFAKYAETDDKELAICLAQNTGKLHAKKKDILRLVEKNDLDVLMKIYLPSGSYEDNKSLIDAVVQKFVKGINGANIATAKYLRTANEWIDKLPDDTKVAVGEGKDKKELTKEELKKHLINLFFIVNTTKTENEDGTKTTTTEYTFNPSRRPTYLEMYGLASTNMLTKEQKEAIVKTIKKEDMGEWQYTTAAERMFDYNVIESKKIDMYRNELNKHYAKMVETLETPEQALEFLKSIQDYGAKPYEEVFNKFGSDKEVQTYLLQNVEYYNSALSYDNRIKLLKTVMAEKDGKLTFDRKNLPEDVMMVNLAQILPKDCTKGDARKIFELLFDNIDFTKITDASAAKVLIEGHVYGKYDAKKQAKVEQLINTIGATELYGDFKWDSLDIWKDLNLSDVVKEKIFKNLDQGQKVNMIKKGHYKNDSVVAMKKGDTIDTVVKNYLKKHLEKFPQLKNSVENWNNGIINNWDDERIDKALSKYMNQFRNDILADLGISDAKMLKEDDIIYLDKIDWEKHQPGWWNYNMKY